ncbi:SDR family NAD(P)-dependent oxidoreductase [Ferrimonas sp. YFM]|uniref:SDR family NAD(P)-dependent oxidoreductase n=1 Tax=Ferrimonas sp. YFM TaxID=3028878 RepID=UPI0025728CA3|nr:SDR family NAD(P)-dependent oxidoreductase [Ferrimonas sp. YFM]BDY07024.1 oxidoreductase [Ferrimonas sp. YFM]
MHKTILITGATDGIGLETAKQLASRGHHLLIHGRSDAKLQAVASQLTDLPGAGKIELYQADLSHLDQVEALAQQIGERYDHLDALINNAGVYKLPQPQGDNGIDLRFMVNTIAPYLLTKKLLPLLDSHSRVVNLSSAAQAPVDLGALTGSSRLSDGVAYAQSKLALTMWNRHLAEQLGEQGPVLIAVNPASMLGSKMVKQAYGVSGGDLSIGADILCRAALSDEFAQASGRYFDNDSGRFADPHPHALDGAKNAAVVEAMEQLLSQR